MDLAGAHQVVEGAHRLLERGVVVEAMGLVEVDVVGLQALQGPVAGLDDVLAREPAVVLAGAGGYTSNHQPRPSSGLATALISRTMASALRSSMATRRL